ncbi:hypothetical protein QYM36_012556 [Artemia franciscana]|nr:hypothetical protein QYM36_012556 [Artemia franciscana]
MFFPSDGSSQRFSAAMSVVNLLIRPVSAIVLYRISQERQGDWGGLGAQFNNLFAPTVRRDPYEDIDRTGPAPTIATPPGP